MLYKLQFQKSRSELSSQSDSELVTKVENKWSDSCLLNRSEWVSESVSHWVSEWVSYWQALPMIGLGSDKNEKTAEAKNSPLTTPVRSPPSPPGCKYFPNFLWRNSIAEKFWANGYSQWLTFFCVENLHLRFWVSVCLCRSIHICPCVLLWLCLVFVSVIASIFVRVWRSVR